MRLFRFVAWITDGNQLTGSLRAGNMVDAANGAVVRAEDALTDGRSIKRLVVNDIEADYGEACEGEGERFA